MLFTSDNGASYAGGVDMAFFDSVDMHLEGIGAVFQFIAKRMFVERKFARFSYGDETGVQLECQRRREDEAARFSRHDGVIVHRYGTELMMVNAEPGQDPRHVDPVWPLWNLLDFTPEGRGDGYPQVL